MKRVLTWLILLSILLAAYPAAAGSEYLGNMEVVNCEEWVSLRESPSTSAKRLVKVSLGAIVSNCRQTNEDWIWAEYDGYGGYILAKYLQPSEGRITFNAMMITHADGAPFYTTIDSGEPVDFIPANTIVRNCRIMDHDRIYVEWGDRCGFVGLLHAEVYHEMISFPQQITLIDSWYNTDPASQPPVLKAEWMEDICLPGEAYDEFLMDNGDDPAAFVLYTDTAVSHVHLFSLELQAMDDETGTMTYDAALEHMQMTVDAQTPLYVRAAIYGATPNLAVGYLDETGFYHFAFVEISGEDGRLILREF